MIKAIRLVLLLFLATAFTSEIHAQYSDWTGPQLILKGNEQLQMKNFEKAMSFVEMAEKKFGSYNTQVNALKAKCYLGLKKYAQCKQELVSYYKNNKRMNRDFYSLLLIAFEAEKQLGVLDLSKELYKKHMERAQLQFELSNAISKKDDVAILQAIKKGASFDYALAQDKAFVNEKNNPKGYYWVDNGGAGSKQTAPLLLHTDDVDTQLFCVKMGANPNVGLPMFPKYYLGYIIMLADPKYAKKPLSDEKISEMVQKLIDLKADPLSANYMGMPDPIQLAYRNNLHKTAGVLAKNGASHADGLYNWTTGFDWHDPTQKIYLSECRNFKHLINNNHIWAMISNIAYAQKKGYKQIVLTQGPRTGWKTPLYWALESGKKEMAMAIYKNTRAYHLGDMDFEVTNKAGKSMKVWPTHTSFQLAVEKNHIDLVRLMLQDGAKWDTGGNIKKAGLSMNNIQLAEKYASAEMVSLLKANL